MIAAVYTHGLRERVLSGTARRAANCGDCKVWDFGRVRDVAERVLHFQYV